MTTYLLGGTLADGTAITPKYLGSRRLIEIAVATLATDRALLLLGVPGTAKTWVSEHLAAAVSGVVDAGRAGHGGHRRGVAALRLELRPAARRGSQPAALVPSPVMRAMETGALVRVEELTRIPADVQDALITILSEKTPADPRARHRGPGPARASTSSRPPTTATRASTTCPRRCGGASTRSCCRCRTPSSEEVEIVRTRVAALGRALAAARPSLEALSEIQPRRHGLPRAALGRDRRPADDRQVARRPRCRRPRRSR